MRTPPIERVERGDGPNSCPPLLSASCNSARGRRCLSLQIIPADAQYDDEYYAVWDNTQLRQRDAQYSILLTVMLMVVILVMCVRSFMLASTRSIRHQQSRSMSVRSPASQRISHNTGMCCSRST